MHAGRAGVCWAVLGVLVCVGHEAGGESALGVLGGRWAMLGVRGCALGVLGVRWACWTP